MKQHIPPFPPDIDRTAFGHWLSGFVDGEGYFMVRWTSATKTNKPQRSVVFGITLRADDHKILSLIKSFFQCGYFGGHAKATSKHGRQCQATICLRISNSTELVNHVIKHFDAFPLRAKKARDYAIWREAVLHKYHTKNVTRLTTAQRELWESFVVRMREQRKFETTQQLQVPVIKQVVQYNDLFLDADYPS